MGFPTSINQGRVLPLTSPKWGSNAQISQFLQPAVKSALADFLVANEYKNKNKNY